jgi:hypothetical protein
MHSISWNSKCESNFQLVPRRQLPRYRILTNSTRLSVGSPRENPSFQLEATTYFRIFAQASTPEPLAALKLLLADETMQHFSGTV